MSRGGRPGVLVAVLVLAAPLAWGQEAGLMLVQTLNPDFAVAGLRAVDLDGQGADELVLIGEAGEVRAWCWDRDPGRFAATPRGTLVLPHPERSLVAIEPLAGKGSPPHLIVASPDGIRAYPPVKEGCIGADGTLLTPSRRRGRARFALRVDQPRFAPICRDVNDDGRIDVLLPVGEECEIWVNGVNPETGAPRLERAARLAVPMLLFTATASSRLSNELESAFTIPGLHIADVNGDGRDDVLVEDGRRRAFHLQRADGTIPPEADIEIDLRIFRDTTPKASLRPGRTLAGGNRQTLQSRDLDGDGIPDYVVAHRRKVWVFHGGRDGPQFTGPSQILKASDDITTMAIVNLDDDAYPDLVVVKVQVPTVATLILGALGEFDVDLAALGYRSRDGHSFDVEPKWRSELTVSLPSVASVVKNPYAILQRFEEASERLEGAAEADLDGDGRDEVMQTNPERTEIRVWLGTGNTDHSGGGMDVDAILRRVLFEDPDKSWNVDRLVEWVGRISASGVVARTRGRDPEIVFALRADPDLVFDEYQVGDFDGDGRAEIAAAYRRPGAEKPTLIDVLRLQ